MIGDERKKHEEEKVKAKPQNDRKKTKKWEIRM